MRLKHSKKFYFFKCPDCGNEFPQAHTLREHLRDMHQINVTAQYANKQKCDKPRKMPKKSKLKYPKRVHETITCVCGQTNKGTYVFRRHVKNKHRSVNFQEFIVTREGIRINLNFFYREII